MNIEQLINPKPMHIGNITRRIYRENKLVKQKLPSELEKAREKKNAKNRESYAKRNAEGRGRIEIRYKAAVRKIEAAGYERCETKQALQAVSKLLTERRLHILESQYNISQETLRKVRRGATEPTKAILDIVGFTFTRQLYKDREYWRKI